jgi:polysaccharide biosynthesis protein VpsQ
VSVRAAARWATLVATLALIAIVVAADRETLPLLLQRVYNYPAGDKAGHFVLFGGLAFLAALGFGRRARPVAGMSVPVSTLVIVALVTLEEASQAWFPGRTASLFDLLASYAGIAAGVAAANLIARRTAVA